MKAAPQAELSISELLSEWTSESYSYNTQLKDTPSGQRILQASREDQRRFIMAVLEWAQQNSNDSRVTAFWGHLSAIRALLRRSLPFAQPDYLQMIRWIQQKKYNSYLEQDLIKNITGYLKGHPLTSELQAAIETLVEALEQRAWNTEQHQSILKLREAAGMLPSTLPILPEDAWAAAAIADIAALEDKQRSSWTRLLQHCVGASGAAPSNKWSSAAQPLLEPIGAGRFRALLVRWLALINQPRSANTPVENSYGVELHPLQMQDRNIDVLRGLIWLCADQGDSELARAIGAAASSAYHKLPQIGPRSVKLGNACIWALGQMPSPHGLVQLSLLKTRLRPANAQKQIETAMLGAAAREKLAPDELEELLVPTYSLDADGLRREVLDDTTVELAIVGSRAELRYIRADGRALAAAPRAIRTAHGARIKELSQQVAEIKAMLVSQRDRIEQLYLLQKSWPLATWREHYLDHPLLGTLARRLIWRFSQGDQAQDGIWHNGQLQGADGQALAGLGEQTRVALWHPLDGSPDAILAWRAYLADRQIQQPFKQAHREIYLITDAERSTQTYSNRFAAHILRQHQFNALCAASGWQNQLRLMVDETYAPAQRLLPAWGLRAEYWIDGAGSEYGTDTNATGTYLYLATDQVRFYPLDAAQNYAHASGGGYTHSWWRNAPANQPLPLEQIPPLVLSEILRDVDMFVGVASVGNDPTWGDGGAEGRYHTYWNNYSFGALSETAKTRREVLERIVPRLKIAARCQLSERFLVVRGNIRTYKIHLGSGNILMEPNDQYLCIVQARGAAAADGDAPFMPFEGDSTLALILSKALLLADDTKIKDPSITHQLKPSA